MLSSAEASTVGLFFLSKRGVPFWKERGVIFTIRGAAQESEVNIDAEVW